MNKQVVTTETTETVPTVHLPEPLIGEIGRAVLATQQEVAEMRREITNTYVRQDVWQVSEQAAALRVGEIAKSIAELGRQFEHMTALRESDRRLMWTALFGPLFTGVVVGIILLIVRSVGGLN